MYFQKLGNPGITVVGHGIIIVLVFCTYCLVSACSERNVQTNEKEMKLFYQAMETMLPPDAEIRRDPGNGTITFLRAKNLSEGLEQDNSFRDLQSTNRFDEITLKFLSTYASLFKLEHPADEFIVKTITTDDLGLKHVRFQQVYSRIPIWGAEIIMHLDQSNHVYLVQGRYIPTPSKLNTIPLLSNEEALQIVSRNLAGRGFECSSSQPALVIFATEDNKPHLAYQILATVSIEEGWEFVVDAKTGTILKKLSTVYTGRIVPKLKIRQNKH